ncbi:Frataxin [Sistotremastrum niveocremeum HHB9708]|nr:Frataxin [Sistotremastrum niveocremeum HHB9708]
MLRLSPLRRFVLSVPRCVTGVGTRTTPPLRRRNEINNTRRHYATPPPQVKQSNLSGEKYHQLSEEFMDTLHESLEELLDEVNIPGYDVEYSSGVLTLNVGQYGTYVINKQPPNKQIWLSSPMSGPKRYDWNAGVRTWVYERDRNALKDLLHDELSQIFQKRIDLGLDVHNT